MENRDVHEEDKEEQYARYSADTRDQAVVHSTNRINNSKGILMDCKS